MAAVPAVAEAPDTAELFVVANEAAGIDAPHRGAWAEFVHDSFTSGYLGIGQAWGDWDNDGWVDLFLAGGQSPSMLYRNDGDGTFSVPRQAADVALADAWTGGAVWADYDNDGWRDLYVLTHGANVLFRNEGGARFRDVTAAAGVGDAGKGATAAWGDYDGDRSGWPPQVSTDQPKAEAGLPAARLIVCSTGSNGGSKMMQRVFVTHKQHDSYGK